MKRIHLVIFTDLGDSPPKSVPLSFVSFLIKLVLFASAISVDSVDNPPKLVLLPGSISIIFRALVIGKKSLPEIRDTEARSSERYWARVGGIFDNPTQLTNELSSKEFREGNMARPVGEGKYAIINHSNNHTELAFVLELPKELGEAQKDLGIEKEAKLHCYSD